MSSAAHRRPGTSPRPPVQRSRSSRPPLLAATLIVKNEAENLPVCLESLTGLVDEIVVYDTGSTDDTVAVARAFGARVVEGYWDDDFARARNASLDAVRADWIIWVDGDDQISGPHRGALRAYLNGDTSVFPGAPPAARVDLIQLRVINVSTADRSMHTLDSIRIARRSRVRWHGRIHELLRVEGTAPGQGDGRSPGQVRAIQLEPEILHVRHRGYADSDLLATKAERNVQIAQAQLDDLVAGRVDGGEPDEHLAARAAFDLARSLLMARRTQEAVEAFEVVRDISPSGLYHAQATLMLAQTLLDAGGHDEVALFLADELAEGGLTSAQFCGWLRGQALAKLGRRGEALELVRGVTELIDPVGNRQSLERVLMARSLFAGAEGLIEESAASMLELVLQYGPREDRCLLLLKLWAHREGELAAELAVDAGPFADDTLEVLARLGEAGERVAALVEQRPRTDRSNPTHSVVTSGKALAPEGGHRAG